MIMYILLSDICIFNKETKVKYNISNIGDHVVDNNIVINNVDTLFDTINDIVEYYYKILSKDKNHWMWKKIVNDDFTGNVIINENYKIGFILGKRVCSNDAISLLPEYRIVYCNIIIYGPDNIRVINNAIELINGDHKKIKVKNLRDEIDVYINLVIHP